ncbi:MAG: ABC transporter permease [Burkholderiales bacterium]|nr:ABC transporter permease [Burkholderiales bacterium]
MAAAQQRGQAAAYQLVAVQASNLPKLTLESAYLRTESEPAARLDIAALPFLKGAALPFAQDKSYFANVNLSLPIYTGGKIAYRVQTAQDNVQRARQGCLQAALGQDRVRAKRREVDALAAQHGRARAALAEANALWADLTVKAPAAGVVLNRLREPGEVVMPGGTALGLFGILVATLIRNMAQAVTILILILILILAPMMFLSGAWTPPEAMPPVMRWCMYLSPLYYFINASYGILMKSAGLALLWPMIGGIVAIGSVVSAASVLRFKKQFG